MNLQIVIGIIAIPVMFLVLIGSHEGGHFLLSKLFRIRVIEFSIGMGTALWSRRRGGTKYAFRGIPIGGYVRLGGMEPSGPDNPDGYDDPHGFHHKPAYQRLLVLVAGPFANFVLASVIMTALLLTQVNDKTTITEVVPGSPAAQQQLQPGDGILTVNGVHPTRTDQLREIVNGSNGAPVHLVVRHRNGATQEYTVAPMHDDKQNVYLIGVRATPIVTLQQALIGGVTFPYDAAVAEVLGMHDLITGRIPGGVLGPQGATGPIGIATITFEAALQGITQWLFVTAALSVALGLANLLPIPALDGGRILVVLLEKLQGHGFDREREMQVQRAGLVALLALIALISYFDIHRLATGQFPGFK